MSVSRVFGGAWEVALRYSHLDLNDDNIRGRELSDITVGLNWYLNSYLRLMFNYIRADLDGFGETNIFQGRLHLHF
jgi:phosphate-selective porin OprO/OprP